MNSRPEQLRIPPGIARLGPEAVAKIEALATDAEKRQAGEIAASTAAALDHVPPVLRGITRRALGI
jgi:hypothetical protein